MNIKRTQAYMNRCTKFIDVGNKLLDIFCKDKDRREELEKKHGIPMLNEDYGLLDSMRGSRTAFCSKVDTRWHKENEKKITREEKQKRKQTSSFESVISDDMEDLIDDDENLHEERTFEDSLYEIEIGNEETCQESTKIISSTPVRRTRSKSVQESSTNEKIHVRHSEKLVRDDVYSVCTELDGEGFSYREMQIAMKVVANRIFKQNWIIPGETDRKSKYDTGKASCNDDMIKSGTDLDTLPTRSTIRKKLKKMQAYSFGLIGDRIVRAKKEESTITHATDSTTRKRVGTFPPSSVHINRRVSSIANPGNFLGNYCKHFTRNQDYF